MNEQLTPEEQRRKMVEAAYHSSELSDLEPSEAFGEDAAAYIRGEITADELMWRTLWKKKEGKL